MKLEDLILIGTVIGAFIIGYAVVSVIITFIKTPRFKPEDHPKAEPVKPFQEDDLPLLEDPTRDPKPTSFGYGDRYGARQPPREE